MSRIKHDTPTFSGEKSLSFARKISGNEILDLVPSVLSITA
jgi:hypothetical protein